MQDNGVIFFRKLLCEPVRRPDKSEVALYEREHGRLEIKTSEGTTIYNSQEVALLGDGNPLNGAMKIGQEHYKNPNPLEVQKRLKVEVAERQSFKHSIEQ